MAEPKPGERKVLGHIFKPMTDEDWQGLAGADEGTLVCYLEDLILLLCPNGDIVAIEPDSNEVTWRAISW